ncbi:MAG: protein-glutamate O-methyltransferase CheR [Magnetovibrio sp.]|nr:protein-glutamate O-methyltransferase CheR [Magnetovibrio sp.]
MTQEPAYFPFVRDMLMQRSGLVVTPEKVYLLETRLLPVAHRHGFNCVDSMISELKSCHNESLAVDVTEAMNTHESLFFRDDIPFKLFKDILLPELLERRRAKKTIRIWCAACSSGQEPYSLAMILNEEAHRLRGWKTEIVATDISNAVLTRAAQGTFTQFEVQRGLPVKKLIQHFTQEEESWQIKKNIRDMIQFRQFNLLDARYLFGKFDIIFCRNVLIYFDLATKSKVMTKISRCLEKDGVLFLGSSESTIGITQDFWPVKAGRGVYKHTDGCPSLAEKIE